jgi:hypothetical protein
MKFVIRNRGSEFKKNDMKAISNTWLKNESRILRKICQITGLIMKTDKIVCCIDDSTTHGFYGGRTITLGVKGGITLDDAKMVIAHELFHIYYWRQIKKLGLTKSSPGNESKKEWELAEVTAFLLTNEPSIKKFWPRAQVYLYPEIKNAYKKTRKFWKEGDLDSFLIKSYQNIRK